MAGQIKGITIEFRGETTQLDKALRKVKQDSKSVDTELKNVNRALKFNPKNTELLTQKQRLLRERVTQTSKSLEELKNVEAQLKKNNVSEHSAEYQKVRREIIETQSRLEHFEAEAKKLASVKLTAFRAQLDETSQKFKTAGDALTKYVTLPLAALGGASGAAFVGVDDALKKIVQLTGAAGDDLAAMEETVKNIAANVPADFDTIATAVGEVNTRFGITGEQLDEVSEKFVKFADINGVDITQAIDSTQKAMSAFGLSADDAGEVLDILTRVSQNTGVAVDKLTSGLVSNSTAFQEMGLDINQASTLMGMLEKSGVNMETVTNGMRKALKNAAKDGKDVNTALIELQDAIEGGASEMDALNMAYDLFGKSGDQIYGAVKSGALDFRELANASTDASGALEDTFERTLTPADKFALIVNRLKVLGYEIANSVLPVIEPVIQKIATGIGKITEKWNALPKDTQQRIIAVAAALAAIGPALILISKLLAGLSAAIGFLTTVVGGLSTALAFLATPIGAIIAGIAALVAAFVLLWEKSEAFRNFFINLWNGIKTTVTAIWNGITAVFTNSWNKIKLVWSVAKAYFTGILNGIKAVFGGVASWFGSVFGAAWSAIKSKFSKWSSFWGGLWTSIKNKFTNIGTSIASAISGAVRSGINGVISRIESVINGGISLINGAINLINKIPKVNIPKIGTLNLPRLAKGGIVDSATLALIGEGKSDEAVIPLDELWKRLERMTDTLTGTGGGSPIVVNVYGAEGQSVNDLAKAVQDRIIEMEKRRRLAWQ